MSESNLKSPEMCSATTSKGNPCRAYAMAASRYCFTHSPDHAEARAAARRRGGNNRPRPSNPSPFPETNVTNTSGLAAILAQVIQETWTLPPSITRSRALAYLVRVQNELNQRVAREAKEAPLRAALDKIGPLLRRRAELYAEDESDQTE